MFGALVLDIDRGIASASRLLSLIEVQRVALGDLPPEIIPAYAPGDYDFGNFVYIRPNQDWYNTPLLPTEQLVDAGLKTRLRRRPHFVEMTQGREASFTLNLTNWNFGPLSGTLSVVSASGLRITPTSREFSLAPDESISLKFGLSHGGEGGDSDIEFELSHGDTKERLSIRARINEKE